MLNNILDLALSNILVTVGIIFVIIFWVCIRIEQYSLKASLFICTMSAAWLPILVLWGEVYEIIKKNEINSIISNAIVSFDFSVGYFATFAPFLLLIIVLYLLLKKISNKVFFGGSPYEEGSAQLALLIIGFVCIVLYGLSALGNCMFFDVYGYGQKAFFQYGGPVIDLANSDGSIFEVSPTCNRIYIENVDIYDSPIKLQNFLTLAPGIFSNNGLGSTMSELFNFLIKIISPIADILGIYQFLENLQKKRKERTKK